MDVNANDLKVGNIVNHKGKLWVILKTMHTQPGKGGAYIQAEMKALLEGTKLNERFRSSERIDRVRLDEEIYQFLFLQDDRITLMHKETFEQITLPSDILGDALPFLQDDMDLTVLFYEGKPLSVTLPETVVLEIVEAEPTIKGQTATSSYKPAVLSNGEKILVPPYLEAGAKVVVDTRDGTFVEKAKG